MRAGEHRCGKIPNGFQGFSHDGGRTEKDAVRESQFFQDLRLIRLHHVVASHVNIAAVSDPSFNFLRKTLRISVCAHIRNDDCFFLIGIDNGTPVLVCVVHKIDLLIDHRAVSGTDHGDIQFTHTRKRIQHKGFKRTDDTVEIILRRPHISLMVRHSAREHIMKTIMGTEGITGHQDLLLLDIGIHGVRPVKIGDHKEPERLPADLHGLIILHGDSGKIPVDDFFQKTDGASCSHDFHLRAVFQKFPDTSRMIRFRMIYDQVIDFRHVDDLFQLIQILVKKFLFCRLKKDDLISGFPYIRIICGSEFCIHDNIKYTKIVVHNTRPVKSVSQFQCFHSLPSLSDICITSAPESLQISPSISRPFCIPSWNMSSVT